MLKFASICPHPPLLIPSIGKENLSNINLTVRSMNRLGEDIEKLKIETIVIISPHGPVQINYMSIVAGAEILQGDFMNFGGDVSMKYRCDSDLGFNIKKAADLKNIPAEIVNIDSLDHGALVPLFFLSKYIPHLKILPISFSYLDYTRHYEFGKTIFEIVQKTESNIAVVASGDLSHRLTHDAPAGYSPEGKKFDELLLRLLKDNDILDLLNLDSELIEKAGECGLRSIIILLGVLSGLEYKFEKLSYEGPFGVGYLVGKFNF